MAEEGVFKMTWYEAGFLCKCAEAGVSESMARHFMKTYGLSSPSSATVEASQPVPSDMGRRRRWPRVSSFVNKRFPGLLSRFGVFGTNPGFAYSTQF